MDYTKNNNSGIAYKLAKRSLKGNKGRNTAAVITIALSVCILLSLLLTSLAVNQVNYNLVKNTYQTSISNLTNDEVTALAEDGRINKVGAACYFDYYQISSGNIALLYYNDTILEHLAGVDGAYPLQENEILVTQSYLDMTEQNAYIGDIIEINRADINGTFIISAIVNDNDAPTGIAYVCFSQSFLARYDNNKELNYEAYLWFENTHDLNTQETQQILTQICRDYVFDVNTGKLNSTYFRYIDPSIDSDNLLGIVLIASVILIAVAIVVYTIFYISIGNKIREYGQLRTLGATKRQIKRIVIYEGMTLAAIGSIAGVILGWILGYALQSSGWNWVNTIWATIAVVIFEILVVWLSVRAPAKMAGSASPIEAGRYSMYVLDKHSRKRKTSYKKSTPFRIAALNLIRNPKKAIFTMLSLGLCGVLFISAASLQTNITAEKEVRYSQYQYGNYKLEVVGGESNSFSEVQQLNNPLNEELRKQILAINGIEEIYEWKLINGTIYYNNSPLDTRTSISGCAPQDTERLAGVLVAGTADYDELSQNNGLIVCEPDTIKSLYGWEPHLGDTVTFNTLTGNGEYVEAMLTVMCIVSEKANFPGFMMLTNGALEQITGTACLDTWEIITDFSNDSEIEQQLAILIQDNPYLRLETYTETVEARQGEFDTGWGMIFVLALLLGVFGLINLINTNATNILSRKQEIGIFQAIGMTGKQLRKSLLSEGVINIAVSALITAALGLPIGYLACSLVNGALIATSYSLPWQAVLIYVAVLLIVQLLLTVYDVWLITKTPVIERVNTVA